MGRYLVVANLTAESPVLRRKVLEVMDRDRDAEFVVLVPAHPVSAYMFWFGGLAEDPIQLAGRRGRRARRRLLAIGARVIAVRVGTHDPLDAIEEELWYGGYSGVIISTLPHRISRWLHRDLPGQVARRHPKLTVVHAPAPALYEDSSLPAVR
jgi:hypothetical protein